MPDEKSEEKLELKKPEPFDPKKGDKVAEKLLRENIEWFKEMAKR